MEVFFIFIFGDSLNYADQADYGHLFIRRLISEET